MSRQKLTRLATRGPSLHQAVVTRNAASSSVPPVPPLPPTQPLQVLTPGHRKAAEAGIRTTPGAPVLQFQDSGYRFEPAQGTPQPRPRVPDDVPPVYSES